MFLNLQSPMFDASKSPLLDGKNPHFWMLKCQPFGAESHLQSPPCARHAPYVRVAGCIRIKSPPDLA